MNFLSHFYLHQEPDDNYFTVGLTVPDLLGFHSKRIRITKNFLLDLLKTEEDENLKSFIIGMIIHIELDKWFHNSDYFKQQMRFLSTRFMDYNISNSTFPQFYSHILVEILIDRYLLKIEPELANNFYKSYQEFDFRSVIKLFEEKENFNEAKFLKLAHDVSYSDFLNGYIYDRRIINAMYRVSKRIDFPFDFDIDNPELLKFIRNSYEEMEQSIVSFFEFLKKDFKFTKNSFTILN